jgi:hypothetical protein
MIESKKFNNQRLRSKDKIKFVKSKEKKLEKNVRRIKLLPNLKMR